jgi:hypothetical protein
MHCGEPPSNLSKLPSDTAWPRLAREMDAPSQVSGSKCFANTPAGLASGVVRRASVSAEQRLVSSEEAVPLANSYVLAKKSDRIEFCRKARKLRATHRKNPLRMLQAISELSARKTSPSIPQYSEHIRANEHDRSMIQRMMSQTGTISRRLMSIFITHQKQSAVTAENIASSVPQIDEFPPKPHLHGSPAHRFAAQVEDMLRASGDSPLRYSQRLELIQRAAALGIGRFEANLQIASVQHRMRVAPAAHLQTPQRRLRFAGVVGFAILQTMISYGAWRMLNG